MQLTIRRYRHSDKDRVLSLFSEVLEEQIRPSFYSAIGSPPYLCFSLCLAITGYLLASAPGALVFVSGWLGLVYYCCHSLYAGFVRERLQTDMQDIAASFLGQPDNCFWVAEVELSGKKAQVVGMVAVVAKENSAGKYGELLRMIISPSCRRVGLGSRMTQTVVDFCQQRGFHKIVLKTSPTAAIALYKKMGFYQVLSHTTESHVPNWVIKLSRVNSVAMEKCLKN